MPYVKQQIRQQLKKDLDALDTILASMEDNSGNLNFVFSYLLHRSLKRSWNYTRLNSLIGLIECCKQELYSRAGIEIEDDAISRNGDLIV